VAYTTDVVSPSGINSLLPRRREPAENEATVGQPFTTITEYTEGAAPEVATLWRESAVEWPSGGPFGGRHATTEGVRHELRGNRPLSTFLAWRPDRVTGEPRAVGFLSLIAQPEDPTATYVGLLTAHPEWHGFGVGRELLTAALDRTVSLGLDRIDLHTWSGNLKAMPLYKKTGFFWVPDTTVRMANFLPMLLKIGPVQDYFGQTGADWYRDAVSSLDVTPDREMCGNAEVYTYQWVREGQILRARIDRHANALLTLETPHLAINVSLDDTRLPIGTTRHASVGITVPTGAPHVSATIVATGEGAVRASHQAHRTIAEGHHGSWTWPVSGTAGSQTKPRPGITSPDVTRVLAIVNETPINFAAAVRVVPPISLSAEDVNPLTPGTSRTIWVTAQNELDVPIDATTRLTVSGPFTVDVTTRTATIIARGRYSFPVRLTANGSGDGSLQLGGRATYLQQGATGQLGTAGSIDASSGDGAGQPERIVTRGDGAGQAERIVTRGDGAGRGTQHGTVAAVAEDAEAIETASSSEFAPPVFIPLHAGPTGSRFVEQTEAHVRVITDDLIVTAPLPSSGWQPSFSVVDRHTGNELLRHSCGLGPPFAPSAISNCSWTPHITRDETGLTVALRSQPERISGVTFERLIRLAGSSMLEVQYRLVNGSSSACTLEVSAGTSAELDGVRQSQIACVVDGNVIVDESDRFPDWDDPSGGASHLSEPWIAEFGDGMVVGVIWSDARDVTSDNRLAELILPFGTVAPGGTATTAPIALYAGPGDWHAVRSRWRSQYSSQSSTSGHAGTQSHGPVAAHPSIEITIERPFAVGNQVTTSVSVTHANDDPMTGHVFLEHPTGMTDLGEVSTRGSGNPVVVPVTLALPEWGNTGQAAFPVSVTLATSETTYRFPVPIVRVGDGRPVGVTIGDIAQNGGVTRQTITLDTGRMRVRAIPTERGRIHALETPSPLATNGAGHTPTPSPPIGTRFASHPDTGHEWTNHLFSSVPDPKPWVWFNPWYGGVSVHLRDGGWHTGTTCLDHARWEWHPVETRRGGVLWNGFSTTATVEASGIPPDQARLVGLSVTTTYLVAGGGTTLVAETTVTNGTQSRLHSNLTLGTYLQPGGSVNDVVVHYLRHGERSRARAHGTLWSTTEGWIAVASGNAGPALTIVSSDTHARMMCGDMGLLGVHPFISSEIDLVPGGTQTSTTYIAVARDLDEARAYRPLVGTALPVADA